MHHLITTSFNLLSIIVNLLILLRVSSLDTVKLTYSIY